MWDAQGKGLVVILVRLLLPPDLELANRAPACGKANVPNLARKWAGPLHNDGLIGGLRAMADLLEERQISKIIRDHKYQKDKTRDNKKRHGSYTRMKLSQESTSHTSQNTE